MLSKIFLCKEDTAVTTFFSKKLYIQGLKKIKISGIAFSLIIILLNVFLPIIGIVEGSSYSAQFRGIEIVEHNQIIPFCMLVILLVPILAHDMFSFLNERNQSDFYHSIPQTRTCVYVSFTSAILTWAFGTILVSAVINSILWTMAYTYTFTFSTVLLGTLPYLVLAVQMAGVMILAMTVTGTRISNFLVAILFFLFARVMGAFAVSALEELTPVIYVEDSVFKYFGIRFFLPFALFEGLFDGDSGVYTDAVLQIYSLLVGILFLVLGEISYRKRRSEIASKSAPSKLLQHVYRFAITLPFVFMIAYFIIMDGLETYQIILVILAILVYLLYEIVTTKRLKNVAKSLPLMIVPVAATALILGGLFITRNTINNNMFSADEIEGYAFAESYSNTFEKYNTERVIVKSDEASAIIADALEKTVNDYYEYTSLRTVHETVRIKLDSGRVVTRRIEFAAADHDKLEQMLINSPEYSEAYLKMPHPSQVISVLSYGRYGSTEEAEELYQCFYDEFNKLSYEDKMAVKFPKGDIKSVIQIGVDGYYRSKTFHSNYHVIFEYMPLTTLKYLEIVGEKYKADDPDGIMGHAEQLEFYLAQSEVDNVEYVYGNISLTNITGKNDAKSVELDHKRYGGESVAVIQKIFDIILSDKNALVYTNPENVYKFVYYVDLALNKPIDEYAPETESYTITAEGGMPTVVVEYYDYSQYFYINNEIYVTISDENFELIKQVINDFENTYIGG